MLVLESFYENACELYIVYVADVFHRVHNICCNYDEQASSIRRVDYSNSCRHRMAVFAYAYGKEFCKKEVMYHATQAQGSQLFEKDPHFVRNVSQVAFDYG